MLFLWCHELFGEIILITHKYISNFKIIQNTQMYVFILKVLIMGKKLRGRGGGIIIIISCYYLFF